MVRRHTRFALRDVTYAGVHLPGATMDCWEDADGHAQWSARVVTRVAELRDEGELVGSTADGRVLTGHALVARREQAPGGRRETLIEFHGSGSLHALGDRPA